MWPVKSAMLEVVRTIPRGRVSRYGAVAQAVSEINQKRITAQLIGRQLSALPEHERDSLPRWRVVAKNGYVSSLKLWDKWWKQIQLLEKEDIPVTDNYVLMSEYAVGPELLKEQAS